MTLFLFVRHLSCHVVIISCFFFCIILYTYTLIDMYIKSKLPHTSFQKIAMFSEESASALRVSCHRDPALGFLWRSDGVTSDCPRYETIFPKWELLSEYCLTLLSARTLMLQGGKRKSTACVSPVTVIYRLAFVWSCEIMGALAARLRLTSCLLSGALQFFFFLSINSTSYGLKL